MKLKEWTYLRLFPGVLWILVHLIFDSLKIRSSGEKPILNLNRKGQRLVYVFWHSQMFFLIKYMAKRNISIIASPSRDGKLGADVIKRFEYGTIMGSSNKSPIRAVIQSVQAMRAGQDIGLAVDGPKGPRHQMKAGALFLAKKMNAPIIPVANSSYPSWTFRSWDRFVLPRPFARSAIVFGKPVYLSGDLSEETIRKETRMIETELKRLTTEANQMTGYASSDNA